MTYTPAMQQYVDMKKQYSDCILFFRMGDFYETFFEDAKIASKVLDLVLTSKNKESENPIPMAGIPYHSVDKYIPKMIHHGYKIAIAEQTTDPVPGKIVEREVTQIITPGTYIQENKKENAEMMGVVFSPSMSGENYHIAWGDFSLGEYQTKSFEDPALLQKFILNVRPVEIIFDIDFPTKDDIIKPVQQYLNCLVSVFDIPSDQASFITQICKIQTIGSFGKALEDGRLSATALLFNYLQHTQNQEKIGTLGNIVRISWHSPDKLVMLDDITIKNLEIFSSSYEGSERHSLIGIIDNTSTIGGARLLRKIIANPIKDMEKIQRRSSNIKRYIQDIEHTKNLHNTLNNIFDIPKIVSNILYKKLMVGNFIKLRSTLRIFFEKQEMLGELIQLGLEDQVLTGIQHLYNFMGQIIKDDNQYQEDINFIRDGYDSKIDELRKIAYHSDELLLNYQQELNKIAGISNVKLKFVMNQGYFIEITNKDISVFEEKVKDFKGSDDDEAKGKFSLIRRNTLKGGQRYTTPYLDSLQEEILKAKEDLRVFEFALLNKAKEKIESLTHELSLFAKKAAWFDLLSSYAILAHSKKYIQPQFVQGKRMNIVGGRHPVIEEFLPIDQQFIPNDLKMDPGEPEDLGFLHIITGPNMGGKSTYLRQNALIVLLAHCGLWVPATTCEMGLVDGIFARVGSGDIITKNQSTFMTEMIEVANILNNATSRSFVIFDELGRGTSTYDGLALTKAILEYIAQTTEAKTLIATHYHELIEMEKNLPGVNNYSVSVYETDKEVVFMKKIVRGGASKSYGLDVAKIAGIPKAIINKALENLDNLERVDNGNVLESPEAMMEDDGISLIRQAPARDAKSEKLKAFIESFDINNITPLQALQLLAKIKDELNS